MRERRDRECGKDRGKKEGHGECDRKREKRQRR